MSKGKILKRIIVLNMIFMILFNHFQILGDCFNMVRAADIEIEEIDENQNNNSVIEIEENEEIQENVENQEGQENNSDIEIEEIIDDSGGENNESEIEIDTEDNDEESFEILPIENVKIDTHASVNNKIRTEKGWYLQEFVSIIIHKNHTDLENAIIEFNSFSINGKEPTTVLVNKDYTSTKDNQIKIEESLINKNGQDIELKYTVHMEYESIENINSPKIVGNIVLENSVETYNEVIDLVAEDDKEDITIQNKYDLTTDNQSLYKGFLRANIVSDLKYETNYSTISEVEIDNAEVIDQIIINDEIDKFKKESGLEELNGKVRYNQTRISKDNYNEIIGKFGFIDIYNNDNLIGTIDSGSEVQNGDYVFNYPVDVDNVSIVINNPNKSGKLTIKNQKSIKKENQFTEQEITDFKAIVINSTEKVIKTCGEREIVLNSAKNSTEINLEETYSKIDLELSKKVLTSEDINDVSINISIDNSSEKLELFKNPIVEITLPDVIEDVEIENVYLVHKNGLSLNSWNVRTDELGKKVIRIELSGSQQEYNPGYSVNDTQIIINTKIKTSEIVADDESIIELRYTNDASNRTKYKVEGKEFEEYKIKHKAKNGLLSVFEINNANNQDESIIFKNTKNTTAKMNRDTLSYNFEINGKIVNNFYDKIENVSVIGRIPCFGVKNSAGEVLNNTINLKLVQEISKSELIEKIYYSPKVNCPSDDESWIENPDNFDEIRSFKMILKDNTLNHGEFINFGMNLNIPEKIGLNQSAYMIYTLEYNYHNEQRSDDYIFHLSTENGMISENECQTQDEIQLKQSNLKIGTRATISGIDVVQGQEIYEGQIIRYSVLIENTSNSTINNIVVSEKANNGNIYYLKARNESENNIIYDWYEDIDGTHSQNEIKIDSLMPNEKRIVSFEVFARKQQGDDVYGIINIKGDGIEEFSINTISGKIVDSEYELELFSSQNNIDENYLKSDSNHDLSLRIRNNTDIDKQNINIRVILPKLVSLNSIKASNLKDYIVDYIEQEDKNILLLVVDNLPSRTDLYYTIPLSIANMPMDILNETISIYARIDENEKQYLSNDYYRVIQQSKTIFDVTINSNYAQNSIVRNGDKVVFDLSVKNIGKVRKAVEIGALIPNGIKVEKIEKIDNEHKTIDDADKLLSYVDTFNIDVNESINIRVEGIVDSSRFDVDQKEIEFKAFSSQFEVNPYILIIDEKDIVSFEWFDENKDDYVVPDESEIFARLDKEFKLTARNEEIYTGLGKSTANIDIDKDKLIPQTYLLENLENDEEIESVESSDEFIEDDNDVIIEDEELDLDSIEDNEKIEAQEQVPTERIAGTAWLDVNRDGINNDEIYLENIDVYLYKDDVKDENRVSTVKTDKDGIYLFNDIEEGNYYVVFDYDSNRFNTAKYNDTISSVYELNLDINNNQKIYAISDKLPAEDINEVNIGLVQKSEIDFAIDSYIESITVINDNNVEKINIEKDNSLPKIEIAKKDITEAIVRVKYIIDITNMGNIGGYVVQLKDIIPEGFVFEEGQNLNWKLGTDGSIYNSSLSNDRIEPNGNKKISLVLTKAKETQVLGAFANSVEIVSTSNDMLIEENNLDNNQNTQDLIISIKTGALTYILLIMLILAFLAIVVLLLVNKIIENKETKAKVIKVLVIVFIVIAILLLLSHSFALNTKMVDSIDSINELLGKNNQNNTIQSYDEYKQICEMLDLYKNTSRVYALDPQNSNSLQYLNRQNESINESNADIAYGISSIFSVNSDYSSYRTLSNNDVVYTGNDAIASKIAFLGYLLENDVEIDKIDKEDIRYNLARLLYNANKDSINVVTDDSSNIKKIIGGSYSLDYDAYDDNSGIYEMMSSKYMQFKNDSKYNEVSKKEEEETSVYNINDAYVGPFYMQIPINSTGKYTLSLNNEKYNVGDIIASKNYVEYYSINDRDWKGFEAELLYNNAIVGKSDKNGEIQSDIDLSNKTIIIKILNDEVKNDVAQIRFRNNHNEYEAAGINFENVNNHAKENNPDVAIIRGKQNTVNSEQSWKYSAYNVSLNNYAYRVYKTENDNITDVVVDTIGNRNEYEQTGKFFNKIGLDLNDIIITCVEFKNNGKAIDGFTIDAKQDSKLTYLGYLDNVPETGVPEIKNDSNVGNWKISNKDSRTYTYSGRIENGESVKIYTAYRLDGIDDSSEDVAETVDLRELFDGKDNIIDLLDNSSSINSLEYFNPRKSYVDIRSEIYSLNRQRDNFNDFNTGDEIIVRTRISNTADDDINNYGTVYNVEYSTNYVLMDDRKIEDYFEFNGFSLVPDNFNIKGTDYVERLDNGENNFAYDLRLDLGILPGDSIDIYTSYTIKNMDEENGFNIRPNNELMSVENRNGGLEVANVNYGPIIRGTNDQLTVQDFTLTISKSVDKVTKSNNVDTGDKTKAEVGDYIYYKITVKGNGTPPVINKPAYVVICLDYSNSMTFWRNYPWNSNQNPYHGGPCQNPDHWNNGRHRNNNGVDERGVQWGCWDRLYTTIRALKVFTKTLLAKNPDNRVALTLFAGKDKYGGEAPADDWFYGYCKNKGLVDFFTDDENKIYNVLDTLDHFDWGTKNKDNVGASTHFDEGLDRAKKVLDGTRLPDGAEGTVLFMTDGDPTLNGDKPWWLSSAQWNGLKEQIKGKKEAKAIKDAGYTLYGYGLGSQADMNLIKTLSSKNSWEQISDSKWYYQWEDSLRNLATKLGSKSRTLTDYVKIKELKLVDTLPTGVSYVSLSSGSTWSNGTITYTNANGVKNNTNINITLKTRVNWRSTNPTNLINAVYAQKVTPKAGPVLYEEKSTTSPRYRDTASVWYQVYKASINKYITKVGGNAVSRRQKKFNKYTKK